MTLVHPDGKVRDGSKATEFKCARCKDCWADKKYVVKHKLNNHMVVVPVPSFSSISLLLSVLLTFLNDSALPQSLDLNSDVPALHVLFPQIVIFPPQPSHPVGYCPIEGHNRLYYLILPPSLGTHADC